MVVKSVKQISMKICHCTAVVCTTGR